MALKEKMSRFFIGSDSYKHEFWQEFRVLVLFTLGFTIAFTWRQTTFDTVESFVSWLTNVQNSAALSILTSTFTTVLCLLIIVGLSKFMQNK